MKYNIKITLLIYLSIAFGMYFAPSAFVIGKEMRAKSNRALDMLLAKSRYAVVMIYRSDKETKRDKELRSSIKEQEAVFRSLSNSREFVEAELSFVRVNVAKDELFEFAQEHGVTQLPTFMLFVGGVPVKKADGSEVVKLEGFKARLELDAFINKHLEDGMDEMLEEKEEALKRKLQQARIRHYERPYYPYFYPYWHYPYWGGYGYYPYRRFGFGFGL